MNDRIQQNAETEMKRLTTAARTVTGNNLKGTVRVVSMAEVKAMAEAVARSSSGLSQEDAARLEAKHQAETNELHRRIAELEAQLKSAAEAQAAAVAAAQLQSASRIKELETILARDDARLRVAHLEQEVARLQALIDRYEAGLEFITTVEHPPVTVDLALADELKGQSGPELNLRLEQIRLGLQAGERALTESLATINVQRKGTIYGVTDLIEHSLNLVHWHNELLSIKQAINKN